MAEKLTICFALVFMAVGLIAVHVDANPITGLIFPAGLVLWFVARAALNRSGDE